METKSAYVILFSLMFLLSSASADIGRHPSIELEVKQEGVLISGEALVCYDTFMPGGQFWNWRGKDDKDYEFIKDYVEGKRYESCFYCSDGVCRSWFYSLPGKIALVYPCYGEQPTEDVAPQVV